MIFFAAYVLLVGAHTHTRARAHTHTHTSFITIGEKAGFLRRGWVEDGQA